MLDQIEKRIEIAAGIKRVWDALTDAHQFGKWFQVKMEGPFVAGVAVGGELTFPGYEHLKMQIVVQEIRPMSFFSYTWHPYSIDAKKDYSQEIPTLVEFRLEERSESTLLVVIESGFEGLPSERYADAFRMNTRGWEQQLESLDAYIRKAS